MGGAVYAGGDGKEGTMNVSEILGSKGSEVITAGPDLSLVEAIRMLVGAGVGCLVIVDRRRVVGILTERDILRENARHFDKLAQTRIADIMTEDVIIGFPDDDVDYLMGLMTAKRIRHVPILSHGQLAGLVSIGDVVKAKVRHAEVEIRHLTDYITGKYPG